jgi:hypothetical protein
MFSSNTTQVSSGGYEIQRSLRFNSADTTYLNRTPASAGNRKTWTWSAWVKRSKLTGSSGNTDINCVFTAYSDTSNYLAIDFATTTTNAFSVTNVAAGSVNAQLVTTPTYRDPSAWYHFVVAVDTTQATASNRIKIYVNGDQVTALSTATYPTQNTDLQINNNVLHWQGGNPYPSFPQHFGGYMTEVNFIDGQALTPSSFGEINADTGVWQPKRYAGSYGTNGFYVNFSNNSNTTAATLGADYSGNGNNWTPNNFSVSAGSGNDSLVDVPTSYGVDTGVGGTVRGNYATLNPLNATPSPAISNGNLYQVGTTNGHMNGSPSTIGVSSGKWYAEVVFTRVLGSTDSFHAGLADATYPFGSLDSGGWFGRFWHPSTGYAYSDAGTKLNSNAATSYGASYTQGDVIGIAFDADVGTLTFYKNGTSQGTAFTGITGTKMFAASCYKDTGITLAFDINLGQRPFAYTAPSGFRALNTQNLPTPTIGATPATQANKYFDVVLRNGGAPSGGTYSTTVNMANGALLWDKPRNSASSNYLVDSVRGISKNLRSNTTDAESTDASWFTGFNNGSFNTGSSDWGSSTTVVDWIWAANGAGVTNTAGSITSTVSANTTSGFSVVTYGGNGANSTIGHGLGAAPRMVIVKRRGAADAWIVYHASLGNTNLLVLNTDAAVSTSSAYWNNTSPTSSVFTVGTAGEVNTNGSTFVAYCFSEIPGYSKFGSYTGNANADGPFCFTGFRPAYILVKGTASAGYNWLVFDATRDPSNLSVYKLFPNLSDAESGNNTTATVDLLSNGFKIRSSNNQINDNYLSSQYIFMAFASAPQKFSLAR